ncbi:MULTISPECIES: hypothetical protein [Clostridium]|uniref:hypothetical protein n=1 Tax=Clostridium TaxID=1485 RepID=UPI000824C7DC|nr:MULTISPECIES: hypothetical protein [Clostridium]PJI08143.1 hypothetical protein CUB90_09815 [Clostridium sp. CT7]
MKNKFKASLLVFLIVILGCFTSVFADTASNSNVGKSGKVTAVKEGTATSTVSTTNGKIAACLTTIKDNEPSKFKLILYMNDGTTRQFYLTQDKIDDFVNWYNLECEGKAIAQPCYIFNVPIQGSSVTKKSYVWFMKIENFEIE